MILKTKPITLQEWHDAYDYIVSNLEGIRGDCLAKGRIQDAETLVSTIRDHRVCLQSCKRLLRLFSPKSHMADLNNTLTRELKSVVVDGRKVHPLS